MIALKLKNGTGLNILCLGAHCDDIEIGCGGTLLELIKAYPIDHIKWIVFTSTPAREVEARLCADYFLHDVKNKDVIIRSFQDGILPQKKAEVKQYFEEVKTTYSPDLIFTHYRHDLHQDHRLVNELTWNTFRNHLILEYEIQKYDGDIGNPSLFVPLDEETVKFKVQALMSCYPSQATKHWFDEETFRAVMRIRGIESVSRYAEAFYMRKSVLS